MQEMSIEHHGERFSASLRVPEDTTLTIGHRSLFRGFYGFSDGEVLVIACEYLISLDSFVREANKVLDKVEEAFLGEHTFKEGIELCKLCVLVAAVYCFPLHEAIFA